MWNQYLIKDACELITGFPFKSKYYLDEGEFKVVRGDNVKTGFIKWDEKTRCWNELSDKLEKFLLKENDIVIGMDGSKVGQNRAIISKEDLPSLLAQRVACLRAKNNFSQDYIKYVILSNNFKSYVDLVKTGTSIPHISLTQIGEFPFEAPSLEEQKIIAKILSEIDEKIRINQKINQNLTLIARNLFKELILKKYDELPNNWKTINFEELVSIQNGFAFKSKDYCDNGCSMVRTKDITNEGFVDINDLINLPIEFYDDVKYENYKFKCFDTILVMVGASIGKIGLITDINIPSLQNQNMWRFRSNRENISPAYVYFYVEHINKMVSSWATGSARLFYRKDMFYKAECILPSNEYLLKFNKWVMPLFDNISSNVMEIYHLENIRDTLLPKLMSGEIDVSGVEI